MINPFRESLSQGEALHDALEACCEAHSVEKAHAELQGVLERATLSAEPAAEPLCLEGPLYLVQCQGEIEDSRIASLFGLVSWSDHGQARVAAGMIKNADVLAVSAVVFPLESAESEKAAPARAAKKKPRAIESDESDQKKAKESAPLEESNPNPKQTRALRPNNVAPETRKAEKDDIDLSAEMAVLTPAPMPAPAKTATGAGGWGAAVAASKAAQASPRSASRAYHPDDLGFDVDGPTEWLPGDILLHPQFGRCRVMAASKGSKVKVRRESGGYVDLVLSVFKCIRQADENNARVFSLRKI